MNTLYQGDNLTILRNMPDASVDLIYADPPFNVKKTMALGSVFSKDLEGITFKDKTDYDFLKHGHKCEDWHERNWNSKFYFLHEICYPSDLYYFERMIPVLEEIKRVLKVSGALYWHCNWRTNHIYRIIVQMVSETSFVLRMKLYGITLTKHLYQC